MYVDVTLTRSKVKVKVTGLLNFRQLAKQCMQAAMTAAPLRGFLVGVLYPYRFTDGGEIWHTGVDSSMPNFTQSVHCVAPQGEKAQKCPLSNIISTLSAARAMLPVMRLAERTRKWILETR